MPIKEDWASCYKNLQFTVGEQTNNRLVSLNGKVKSVCSKFASLDTFFSELFVVLHVLLGERTQSCDAGSESRLLPFRTTGCLQESDDVMYVTCATPYALIEKQLVLRDAVTVPEDGRPFQSSEGNIIQHHHASVHSG